MDAVPIALQVDNMILSQPLPEENGFVVFATPKADGPGRIVFALQELDEGTPYYTENGNTIVRVDHRFVRLSTPCSGDEEAMSLDIKMPTGAVVPTVTPTSIVEDAGILTVTGNDLSKVVLLDASQGQGKASAEEIIEKETGQKFKDGIPLVRQGEQGGCVIFSLEPLEAGCPWMVESNPPCYLERLDEYSFLVNGNEYQKASILTDEPDLLNDQGLLRSDSLDLLSAASSFTVARLPSFESFESAEGRASLSSSIRVNRKEERARRLSALMQGYSSSSLLENERRNSAPLPLQTKEEGRSRGVSISSTALAAAAHEKTDFVSSLRQSVETKGETRRRRLTSELALLDQKYGSLMAGGTKKEKGDLPEISPRSYRRAHRSLTEIDVDAQEEG